MGKNKLRLTDARTTFKPFTHPEFYDYWLMHETMHWIHTEVELVQDVKDWQNNLSNEEKYFLTNIFRFFTQSDIDVAGGYVNNYLPILRQPELRMMLLGFAAREAVHIAAYSHLIETLGMPESTYTEFLQYEAMKNKHEYIESFVGLDRKHLAQQIALFSAFTEGMQLFSSFVMLLNFPRRGKMKGMGQIISWSILDEALISETQVLTTFGWKNINEITESDFIYQYDIESGICSFVNPTHIHQVSSDESYEFESEDFHQHVSPNHRMILESGEILAKDATGHETYILNGLKLGIDDFTDSDKDAIRQIVNGQLGVSWLYGKMNSVSSRWAENAVNYYLSLS